MHGALPLFMLVPSPERLKRSRRKSKPHFGQSEDRILKAKLHIAFAAIACGIVLTTTATAGQSDDERLTKVVSYADLNLNAEAGARTLYGRLRTAASQVCSPLRGNSLRERTNWRACFSSALARSVADVDQPLLTAYHLNRTGKTEPPSQVAQDQ